MPVTYCPDGLTHGAVLPSIAQTLFERGASQCWSSPQEADEARSDTPSAIPDGFVDECGDCESKFFRIWHKQSRAWLNAYA